ncbi:MAG: hypothetical protein ACUVSK_13875 [Desulfotomaculales bacterium]
MPVVAQILPEEMKKALWALFPEGARVGAAVESGGAPMEAAAVLPAAETGTGKERRRKKAGRRAKAKKVRREARRRMRALEEMCRRVAADEHFRDAVWRGHTRLVCDFIEDFAAFDGVAFRTKKEFWHAVQEATRLVAVS